MLRDRLKAETRVDHEETEKSVGSDRIMSGTLTRDQYEDILLKQYMIHADLEQKLQRIKDLTEWSELEFELRKKISLLNFDLQLLGVNPKENHSVTFDFSPSNLAQGIGCLYVLEGSTLGGAVIKRKLESIPEIADTKALQFYGAYGENLGMMWKKFIACLDQLDAQPEIHDEVVESARQTFKVVKEAFALNLTA